MLQPQQLNVEQLLRRLDELTPMVRAHASEADRLARLPEEVVNELRALR